MIGRARDGAGAPESLMIVHPAKHELEATQWRHQVLEVALNATSVLTPVLLLALVMSRRDERLDQSLIVYVTLVGLLVGLRFMPRRGYRLRAALLIGALQLAGVAAIASSGLLPGSGMAALVSIVLTGIFFGRRTL